MPVTPATAEDLARIAAHYGFSVTDADLRSFGALAGGLIASYDEVERLYEATRPTPPRRGYQWPTAGSIDLGAWYVTTDIGTGADGPLTGGRVAVKDNIAVAGVPMMNGSVTVQGFVPARQIVGRHFGDATCLRAARAVEQAVGGFPAPPKVPDRPPHPSR